MKKLLFSLMLCLSVQLLSSQIRSISPADANKKMDDDVTLVSHTVQLGETVKLISKKYLVTPLAIYKLNKSAVDGVQPGMVLQIPVPNSHKGKDGGKNDAVAEAAPEQPSTEAEGIRHNVSEGETLSAIASRYGVSVDALKEVNPQVATRELHTDETLVIPDAGGILPSNEGASMSVADRQATYKVKSGDTLSGLANKFHTTIAELKELNPKLASRGLRAGETIKVADN